MLLSQSYTGRARYQADFELDRHRLFVAVPCLVEGDLIDALLDTGSEWCLLPGWMVAGLDLPPPLEQVDSLLHSPFGTLSGRVERIAVEFHADEGQPLSLEATWFLSEDWIGPPVIGWKGCLERLRFALDPGEEQFYFAEL